MVLFIILACSPSTEDTQKTYEYDSGEETIYLSDAPQLTEEYSASLTIQSPVCMDGETLEFGEYYSPFIIAGGASTPILLSDIQNESCSTYTGVGSVPGRTPRDVDVGSAVPLQVGIDVLAIRRTTHFEEGETLYLWEKLLDNPYYGASRGAPIIFDYVSTGLTMPAIPEWEDLPGAWLNFLETGILELRWLDRGQENSSIQVSIHLDSEVIAGCMFVDDGYARLDVDQNLNDFQIISLDVGRVNKGGFEHPEFGLVIGEMKNEVQTGLYRGE